MEDDKIEEEIKNSCSKSYKIISDRWRHRRSLAYMSFFSILIVTFLCLFILVESRLVVLEPIVGWFYIVMGSIIGAYVGFTTLDDKWNK